MRYERRSPIFAYMQRFACDWLFTGTALLRGQTVTLDADGQVLAIAQGRDADAHPLPGLVSPAFVNAHCHLELSHLKGMIPTGTGMAGFVRALQPIRDRFSDAEREVAMESALEEMRAGGIAAIGDICNGLSTLPTKQAHPEFVYHNFIELFGLNPGMAEEIFIKGLELLKAFGRQTSITPHAPYSISVALRDKLLGYAQRREWPQSIHLLESQEERRLFEDLDGPLMDFIRDIGAVFQAHTYRSAAEFVMEAVPHNCNVLLVHATEMLPAEWVRIKAQWPRAYVVLCPLANAYIHGRQPDAHMFATQPDRICLGTDSLAGNTRLSILAEAQHLQSWSDLPTETLLRWATLNGAVALGLDARRFEVGIGHRPTLIHLPAFTGRLDTLAPDTTIQFITP
jgi:cytosine/adenosine deaminase-related metal-dependent hydrolase